GSSSTARRRRAPGGDARSTPSSLDFECSRLTWRIARNSDLNLPQGRNTVMREAGSMKDPLLRRILFVEDDPDIQTVAKMALEAIGGFHVLACGSGSEALSRLSDFSPDLVLLDVVMPGMDGPSTLAALRQIPAGRDLPVVFMTSRVDAQ